MSSGWASQWYQSNFSAELTIDTDGPEKVTFPTAEHYMMVRKALLFNDPAMAREILAATDLAEVRALGRRVQNFEEKTWVKNREEIVLQGNLLKFGQNEELKKALLATGTKRLVEASPKDRIWGVGFGEKNALAQKARWGLNLLGIALERTRESVGN